jgi:hypothetical protein
MRAQGESIDDKFSKVMGFMKTIAEEMRDNIPVRRGRISEEMTDEDEEGEGYILSEYELILRSGIS